MNTINANSELITNFVPQISLSVGQSVVNVAIWIVRLTERSDKSAHIDDMSECAYQLGCTMLYASSCTWFGTLPEGLTRVEVVVSKVTVKEPDEIRPGQDLFRELKSAEEFAFISFQPGSIGIPQWFIVGSGYCWLWSRTWQWEIKVTRRKGICRSLKPWSMNQRRIERTGYHQLEEPFVVMRIRT